MTVEWINAEYFPKNAFVCPPSEAVNRKCELYRFGVDETVSAQDFVPLTSEKRFRDKYQDNYELLCQGSGLSSFPTLQDTRNNLNRMNKNVPALKRKFKSITKISISENDGVIMDTPSKNTKNHLTWWGYTSKIDEYILKSETVRTNNTGGD